MNHKFSKLIVKKQMRYGDTSFFVLESLTEEFNHKYKKKIMPLYFIQFRKTGNGLIKWNSWRDNDLRKLEIILGETIEAYAYLPGLFEDTVKNSLHKFDQKIVLLGSNTEFTLELQFNGESFNEDIFVVDKHFKNNVLRSYQKLYLDFRDSTLETYAEQFTLKSKKRVLELEKYGNNAFNEYRDYQLKHGRIVEYIIDADPLYIVFCKPSNELGYVFSRFEYLIKDASSGNFKRTNYHSIGFLDSFLFTESLFEEKVSKKIIEVN